MMKVVGVAACTVGIAHTYIAQEKLENAAKKAGCEMKVETQGTIGIEEIAVKSPNKLIEKAQEVVAQKV